MFGDAGTGLLGFHELAHLNPLRWSGKVESDKAIADLKVVQQHRDRPILLKLPAYSRRTESFEKTADAIAYIESKKASAAPHKRRSAYLEIGEFKETLVKSCNGTEVDIIEETIFVKREQGQEVIKPYMRETSVVVDIQKEIEMEIEQRE